MTKRAKRIGRPPLPAKVARKQRVVVAMSPAELERVEQAAKEAGLPPSVYMRRRSLGE